MPEVVIANNEFHVKQAVDTGNSNIECKAQELCFKTHCMSI